MVNVLEATEAMLASLALDEAGEARAAVAVALARRIDDCGLSKPTGGDPMAGLAKEWREVVDAILETTGDDSAFVAGLFAEVGNT